MLDDLQQHLYELLVFGNVADAPPDLLKAVSIRNSDFLRPRVESLLFGGAPLTTIFQETRLDEKITEIYKHLFCDVDIFEGVPLFVLEYVMGMPEYNDQHTEEKELYKKAALYGWERALWEFSGGMQGFLDETKAVSISSSAAFWRGLDGAAAPLGSKQLRESRLFMKTASDTIINKSNAGLGQVNSIEQLRLRLKQAQINSIDKEDFVVGHTEYTDDFGVGIPTEILQ